MFRTACEQYRHWQTLGIAPPSLSINLSGRQFQDAGLIDDIQSIVAETGLHPQSIELELTETFLMEKPEETIVALQTLKSIGFCIAVDDFGTAYSSLSYLKRFPVDTLKIDRSFICDIPDDSDDVEITKAIISMARSLNLGIIAEGVETELQLEFLSSHGCHEVQGYYFSRPLGVEDASQLLQSNAPFASRLVRRRLA